ncbi:MAG TPA: sugar phosphate isomerase/epimerase family protein [Planosporangium sp.]|nr:sugar phosphate isomerase/epimerase family protein [Planosporangium sp.]
MTEGCAVQIALDPYMFRSTPLTRLPGLVADLGYEYLELSPREDFLPFFTHPRADRASVAAFRSALSAAGVKLACVLPLYRWSGPDSDDRQAAVRYWKRAIEITVELGCTVMNSEFNGRPEQAGRSEAQFWRSLEELLPVFEREGVRLVLEPHPDDFVEDGRAAVDLIRGIDSPLVSFLYCAPHTFHMGGDIAGIMEYAGPLLTHLHVADSFDHRASSGLRYIVNPPGSTVRVHQHLDLGQGEVDWEEFFGTLRRLRFDGIMTACVFAWEDRAEASSRFMREQLDKYTKDWPVSASRSSPDAGRASLGVSGVSGAALARQDYARSTTAEGEGDGTR